MKLTNQDKLTTKETQKKIAIFLRDLDGGGIQKVVINLAKEMAKNGISIDIVVTSPKNSFLEKFPSEIEIVNLNSPMVLLSVFLLVQYLKRNKIDILLSNGHSNNLAVVIAKVIMRLSTHSILITHTNLSLHKLRTPQKFKLLRFFMRLFYPYADTLVAVSQGTARELESELGLRKNSVKTIYNPIVNENLITKINEPLDHPWFQPNQPPVFLAVGRLSPEKDYINMLQAFAHLRTQRQARLLILGEGNMRSELELLAKKLGIESDVYMPGFVNNPYAYMSRSSVFVLSSQYEALPTVICEAMACGCSVVSTNCNYGPSEILENGKYGLLVPIKAPISLADAMLKTLDNPIEKSLLLQRANDFRADYILPMYLDLMGFKKNLDNNHSN
jgi:glycosyltransferase involved in cell wall biosynthesis